MSGKNQPSEFTCNIMNKISLGNRLNENTKILDRIAKELNTFSVDIGSLLCLEIPITDLSSAKTEELRRAVKVLEKLVTKRQDQVLEASRANINTIAELLENQNAKRIKAENALIDQIEKGSN